MTLYSACGNPIPYGILIAQPSRNAFGFTSTTQPALIAFIRAVEWIQPKRRQASFGLGYGFCCFLGLHKPNGHGKNWSPTIETIDRLKKTAPFKKQGKNQNPFNVQMVKTGWGATTRGGEGFSRDILGEAPIGWEGSYIWGLTLQSLTSHGWSSSSNS